MTTYDLMILVKEELQKNGFTVTSPEIKNRKEFEVKGSATKDGKSRINDDLGYPQLSGYTIDFNVVDRRNGSNENISVDLKIFYWENNRGNSIARERITVKNTEKTILKKIKKILDEYDNMKEV